MNNIEFIVCVGSKIKKLVNEAEKMNCVAGYEALTHAKQYVIKGFDYDLSCVSADSEKRMINLKNYEYIVFSYVDNKALQYVHAILFSYDIMCNMSDLLNEKQDLLDDNQVLIDQVSKLRDDLSERDKHISKLKGMLEWQKIMFDVIQSSMYSALLGESK